MTSVKLRQMAEEKRSDAMKLLNDAAYLTGDASTLIRESERLADMALALGLTETHGEKSREPQNCPACKSVAQWIDSAHSFKGNFACGLGCGLRGCNGSRRTALEYWNRIRIEPEKDDK